MLLLLAFLLLLCFACGGGGGGGGAFGGLVGGGGGGGFLGKLRFVAALDVCALGIFLKTVKQYLDSYVVYLRNDRDAHNLLNQRFYAQCRLLLRLCLHGLVLVIDPNNKANLALVGNKYYCRYVCRKCENLCV